MCLVKKHVAHNLCGENASKTSTRRFAISTLSSNQAATACVMMDVRKKQLAQQRAPGIAKNGAGHV